MSGRDFHALVESLDKILSSTEPAHRTVEQIKNAIHRARYQGNIDSSLILPNLDSPTLVPQNNGFLEALAAAVTKARANFEIQREEHPRSPYYSPTSSPVTVTAPREAAFGRCFPLHAKYFTYPTQKSMLLRRTKHVFTTGISPDTLHFALCSAQGQYYIYRLPDDLDDGPQLKFQGTLPPDKHYYVSMNNHWLVLGSSTGNLTAISLDTGETLWEHAVRFAVGALAISANGAYIAVSICLIKKQEQQPVVLLLCPDTSISEDKAFSHVAEIPFYCPYRDIIRTISFSNDELYLLCSTEQESRFFVVSLLDPREPRLVLRSSRKIQHDDPAYEGITSLSFFPNKLNIVVTSCAQSSPPIVVDPRLNHQNQSEGPSLSSSSSRMQSQVLLRADKIGSSIYKATVSPRENAIAFLDKSGLVYVMFWAKNIEYSKKYAVVFDLAASYSVHTAASLRFSEDGTVLYAVDRKGVLHIADFGAGMPQSAGISRLRVLT